MLDLHVIGIDPGFIRGTGVAHCVIGKRRQLLQTWCGVYDAETIARDVGHALEKPGIGLVCIETMAAMGPRTGLQKVLDNAQFVGEIVGRLEAWGAIVFEVKKLEVLRGLGIKGKAPAGRVRRVVGSIFGEELPKRFTDHEVDALAVAYVGSLRAGVEQKKVPRAGVGTVVRVEGRR
jgi:Holliday junction resolvasome RuvABC endonuclease subunit